MSLTIHNNVITERKVNGTFAKEFHQHLGGEH